ncbi:MAG TPA: ABC transporter permease, partial [Pyrinomonadaceae bacterium]|nr:ABC transporter permease [Pyrinomonadaceae bacterium]
MTTFINSFQSEWLKTKRSLAFWMVMIGGFFTPTIIIVARLLNYDKVPALYSDENFWTLLWKNSWESMAIFFLPLGAILSTSLIAQIEYKNNTWKQLHTLPLSYTTIFFAKLAVILVLMLQFFVLFNIGIYLAAVVPYLLISGTPYPVQPLPYQEFLQANALYFVDTLPIVALQYLIALRFKNFLVPVGLGFVFWVGSLAALTWHFGYIIPYTYPMYHYLGSGVQTKAVLPDVNIHWLAFGYFVVITIVSYAMYLMKREKG